ncbi:MAG: hypothetical protein ACI936_000939 [Paraglaciecola sp.]|jgi:hypothetical protein
MIKIPLLIFKMSTMDALLNPFSVGAIQVSFKLMGLLASLCKKTTSSEMALNFKR